MNLFQYTMLRMQVDPRPRWARSLGIHSLLLNDDEVFNPYPRLRYKRKIGSHVVNPHAEESYRRKEEERYEEYLKELNEISKNEYLE